MSESEDVLKAKICLIGDSCVGKTSLIRRYVHNEFDDRYVSTLGARICKKEMTVDSEGGDVRVNMTIWDIMGEKGFRELLMDSYFDGAGGILAVCDLTREETFEGLKDWITAVRLITGDVPIAFGGTRKIWRTWPVQRWTSPPWPEATTPHTSWQVQRLETT